jgi:hypothetical protein
MAGSPADGRLDAEDTTSGSASPPGTPIDVLWRMDTPTPTVESSLGILEDVLQNAAADLLASRNLLARARGELASANTSVSRTIIADADHVVEHLKSADLALKMIIQKLNDR